MKHLILTLLLLTSMVHRGQTIQVAELMKEQEASWNRGDIAGFMEHYWKHDSLKFIGSKGITYGWNRTFENYRKAFPTREKMGTLSFTLLELTALCPDRVFVVGKWELNRQDKVGGHFCLLWKLVDKKWVIVCDHTS